jgi:hypothetical protein
MTKKDAEAWSKAIITVAIGVILISLFIGCSNLLVAWFLFSYPILGLVTLVGLLVLGLLVLITTQLKEEFYNNDKT